MFQLIEKAFKKFIRINPALERMFRYRDPREYWTSRGGKEYFEVQEMKNNRTLRSQFIAERIGKLDFNTLLEVGCGYGKQLKNILSQKNATVSGIDFSRPQLQKGKEYLSGLNINLVEADASRIPIKDKSFDAVLSSAVILHNAPEQTKKILSEMVRISKKYLVFNEDTDVTFSRYGYDMKKIFERLGFKVIESCEIPVAPDPSITQFTIVQIPNPDFRIKSEDISLLYH